MASGVPGFINRQVSVLTNDSRHYIGTLVAFDQATNVVLSKSKLVVWGGERSDIDTAELFLRGDTIAAVFLVSGPLPESGEDIGEFPL